MLRSQRLIYISRSKIGGDIGKLTFLREQSIRNNQRDGVKGALYYDGHVFFQVLEGPEPRVEGLLQRLRADPRHADLHVVCRVHEKDPMFTNWDMKFVSGIADPGRAVRFKYEAMTAATEQTVQGLLLELKAA